MPEAGYAACRMYCSRIYYRKRLGLVTRKNGTVCGIELPEGLQESDKLPEPIYTPTTKAELGDHDEHVSFEETVETLEKLHPGRGRVRRERFVITPLLFIKNVQNTLKKYHYCRYKI